MNVWDRHKTRGVRDDLIKPGERTVLWPHLVALAAPHCPRSYTPAHIRQAIEEAVHILGPTPGMPDFETFAAVHQDLERLDQALLWMWTRYYRMWARVFEQDAPPAMDWREVSMATLDRVHGERFAAAWRAMMRTAIAGNDWKASVPVLMQSLGGEYARELGRQRR